MSRSPMSPSRDACHQLGCSSKEDPELDVVLQWLESIRRKLI